MSAPRHAQDVLLFWFGLRPYSPASVAQHARLWFGDPQAPELTPQTDELIRERFSALIDAAEHDQLAAWESSPRRRLGLILLIDQFPRNVYRGTARAFAHDHQALSLAVSGMQSGGDATLDPVERIFFYMPLMHAEALDVQQESVAAYRRLLHEAPPELRATFENCLKFAQRHQDIIARFERFPHRNRVLGRDSTVEEKAWLTAQSERFGQ